MGSPIDTWEGAGAYFTGAGGASPMILLIVSFVVCFGLIAYGAWQEEASYKHHKA